MWQWFLDPFPKKEIYWKYLTNFSQTRASYFFDIQKLHYHRIVLDSLSTKEDIQFCDKTKTVNEVPGFRQFVFEGMPRLSQDFKTSFETNVDVENNDSLWMKFANHSYHYFSLTKFYPLVLILFWALFLMNTHRMMKGTPGLFYPFLVAMIYVGPLLILPLIHPRFVDRYITVSEFAVLSYVALCLKSTYHYIKGKFIKRIN